MIAIAIAIVVVVMVMFAVAPATFVVALEFRLGRTAPAAASREREERGPQVRRAAREEEQVPDAGPAAAAVDARPHELQHLRHVLPLRPLRRLELQRTIAATPHCRRRPPP